MSHNNPNTLAPYRNAKSKAIIAASLLIPFGTVAFFILFSHLNGGEYAFDASVKVSTYYVLH